MVKAHAGGECVGGASNARKRPEAGLPLADPHLGGPLEDGTDLVGLELPGFAVHAD